MFEVESILKLGIFNQLIPIWQVFFFILSLLPFLLLNRVKICLLITFLFTYYFGFMVQWGEYISAAGFMGPFVLYALSGLTFAAVLVAAIFKEETSRARLRWARFGEIRQEEHASSPIAEHAPQEEIDVTGIEEKR